MLFLVLAVAWAEPRLDPAVVRKPVTIQRREAVVSVIGLSRPKVASDAAGVEMAIRYWTEAMDREAGNRPDMFVLPETCDTVYGNGATDVRKWLNVRGDRVLKAMSAYAKAHRAYVVYPAHRQRADGKVANSIFLIDREGDVVGVYDKYFPMPDEEIRNGVASTVPGTRAVVVDTDFGRIGMILCYDLNFPELMNLYAAQHPDMIAFCAAFDGGFMHRTWARACQAYMIVATAGEMLAGRIVGPAGEELRTENYYMPTFTAKVNTNCRVVHLDNNRVKFPLVTAKYGRRIEFRNPGPVGPFTLLSHDPDLPVDDVMREFGMESLDAYLDRSRKVREEALK